MLYPTLLHLHLGFTILFVLSYSIKSVLFLMGKTEAYLAFRKKSIIPETICAVIFLVTGIMLVWTLIGFGTYQHWLDPKITLAIIGIPVGIIGFKKNNKVLVGLSWIMFLTALAIGLSHYH
jgi:uncharacterized membrane protein SirB2